VDTPNVCLARTGKSTKVLELEDLYKCKARLEEKVAGCMVHCILPYSSIDPRRKDKVVTDQRMLCEILKEEWVYILPETVNDDTRLLEAAVFFNAFVVSND